MMKNLIVGVFILIAMASCSKSQGVKPVLPIDTDAFIHHISFSAPTQFAATSVSSNKLNIIYYENVTLLIPTKGLDLSYALHLKEDVTNSQLFNFDFTTVDASGDVTHNWVDDNLNNITAKTLKDTVVNSLDMTKITVQRPFTYSKTYATADSALSEEQSLLKITTDKILVSSYVFFTKTYPATSTDVSIYYVKK